MNGEPVTVNKIIIESNMNYQNTPVLHYKIEYPHFQHSLYQNEMNKINEWYRSNAKDLQRKYETELYQQAIEQYEYSQENQFPFHMYEAVSVYEVTYNEKDLLSLYLEDYVYSGGAHGGTVKRSDTWDIKNGSRVLLYQFAKDPTAFQRQILNKIREQIAYQIEKGEGMYFDDYPELIIKYFNPESYYLTPNGLVIYYQQYDIAPYASGMPEFII